MNKSCCLFEGILLRWFFCVLVNVELKIIIDFFCLYKILFENYNEDSKWLLEENLIEGCF